MSNLDESAHQTLAEDASRDTAENEADFNEDQPNQSGASFTVLERSLEEVQPRKKGRRSIEADKSPHIEARHERKKRKKCHGNPPATDGDAKTICKWSWQKSAHRVLNLFLWRKNGGKLKETNHNFRTVVSWPLRMHEQPPEKNCKGPVLVKKEIGKTS